MKQEDNAVINLIQNAPNGYVTLEQLKEKYHEKYGKHLHRRLEWIRSLTGVYVDDDPIENSIYFRDCRLSSEAETEANLVTPNHPNHHTAIVKTLEAHNGRISLNEFKKKW